MPNWNESSVEMRASSGQDYPPAYLETAPLPNPTAQEHTMKAIVQDRYGGPEVLEFREIDIRPALPTDLTSLVHRF